MQTKYKLVYNFQKPDPRDHTFKSELVNGRAINTVTAKGSTLITPATIGSIFTIPSLAKILDQGNLGDCVANAFAYSIMSQTKNAIMPSRLFVYANCRCIDYTPLNHDDGTTVRTACTAISNYGVCQETVFPYNVNNFANLPPLIAFQSSSKFKTFKYTFIAQNLTSIKSCLTTYTVPIVMAIMVYSSFMTNTVAKNGIVPMPNTQTETQEGGHCVCIVGYNDATQMFKCANSWGTSWGINGYFFLPYNYVINTALAGDLCIAQLSI
jgi:C1A family cysteine protease